MVPFQRLYGWEKYFIILILESMVVVMLEQQTHFEYWEINGVDCIICGYWKGYLAASLPFFLSSLYYGFKDEVLILQLVASLCAVVGHVFPVFANFRGGKGVATTLGIILAINLDTALISLAIFLIVFIITQYVSLGAIIASILFPFISFFAMHEDARIMIIFSILVSLIVLFSHRKNINRLLRGEENKMNFLGRKA